MSGAELILGVVGAVAALDVAIKACKTVVARYSAFEHAEAEICERSTRLLSNCLQMGRQIAIFNQIKNQLNDQGHDVQIKSFKTLATKIHAANDELATFMDYGSLGSDTKHFSYPHLSKRKRMKFATRKNNLDKAIGEVETWQRLTFDPLWFETIKVQTQELDKLLKNSQNERIVASALTVRDPLKNISASNVFLPPEKLESAKITEIVHSSGKLVQIDHKWRLLDVVPVATKKDAIRELVVRLKSANPSTFGLLTCLGAVHHQPSMKFSIVFRIPDRLSTPETLRSKLRQNTKHSLTDRFRLATQLARAVFHIHTFDMVHKSIRPENIIVFQDPESSLGTAFLLGFERIRRDADGTGLSGDGDWAQNLYRHPQRQGTKIEERYIMQHDIYSLGVCLLEIGLWTTFVDYNDVQLAVVTENRYGFEKAGPEASLVQSTPEVTKSRFLEMAIEELPTKMGTKYAEAVQSCLTCLDLGNDDFGDETELEECGINVGVRYIEKVLMQLSDISI